MQGFDEILDRDLPLASRTYYRIGGVSERFYRPRDAAEAAALLRFLNEAGEGWRVLGGGANLLIEDGRHPVPIIATESLRGTSYESEGEVVHLRAGAGESFPRLVAETVRRGLAGFEGLAGIPGFVGGICAMNAGGRHAEVCEVVHSVQMATPEGELIEISAAELTFRYRRCELPPGLVTAVTFALREGDPGALRERMAEILAEKKRAQPLGVPSSGCVFKNPAGGSAGLLVESLGLKGRRIGDAEISERHGNFILNRGEARSREVVALIETIEAEARDRAGVDLEREIKIWPAGPELT